jgi:DNA-binding response OmpR family regulator
MYSEADCTFMKVLLIDDSRFLRVSNERALTRAGHQVTTASDGEEGLRLAIDQRPDLIVLDMMLPKLSGPDVLHALRKSPATAAIPVMVLTSLPQANERRLITEGATAYFEKALLTLDQGSSHFVDAVEKMLSTAVNLREKPCAKAGY